MRQSTILTMERPRSTWRKLAHYVVASVLEFRRHRRLRATINILNSLDDRSLRDIGLGRSEIEGAVRGLPGRHAQQRVDLYDIIPRE